MRHVHLGCADKAAALTELVTNTGIGAERMAHVGDDCPDLPLFARVGMAIAVADAHPLVRERANYVTATARRPRRRAGSVRSVAVRAGPVATRALSGQLSAPALWLGIGLLIAAFAAVAVLVAPGEIGRPKLPPELAQEPDLYIADGVITQHRVDGGIRYRLRGAAHHAFRHGAGSRRRAGRGGR